MLETYFASGSSCTKVIWKNLFWYAMLYYAWFFFYFWTVENIFLLFINDFSCPYILCFWEFHSLFIHRSFSYDFLIMGLFLPLPPCSSKLWKGGVYIWLSLILFHFNFFPLVHLIGHLWRFSKPAVEILKKVSGLLPINNCLK